MKKPGLSRRKFIAAASSAVGAFTLVPGHILGRGEAPPSEKLNIAGVGIGGRGFADLRAVERENIVALCDVDQSYAAGVFQAWPQARRQSTSARCSRPRRTSTPS